MSARAAAVLFSIGLSCITFTSDPLYAFTRTVEVNDLVFHLYGPDWIWQGRDVNLLIVAENRGGSARLARVVLVSMGEKSYRPGFSYSGPDTLDFSVPPHGRAMSAFVGLTARKDVTLGRYTLPVSFSCDGISKRVENGVRIIRGEAVRPGLMVVVVPSLLAGLWCLVIVVYLSKVSGRGAWRVSKRVI